MIAVFGHNIAVLSIYVGLPEVEDFHVGGGGGCSETDISSYISKFNFFSTFQHQAMSQKLSGGLQAVPVRPSE